MSIAIQFGTAAPQPDGPAVAIDPMAGDPLRLNDGPYSFGALPPGGIGTTTAERLAFLRDEIGGHCDLWAKRAREFLALYFRFVEQQIARDGAAIDQHLRRFGGLFARQDYGFSALRPLPRAHLPLADGTTTRVDFAFWTGRRLVAVDIIGDDARDAARDTRRRQFAAADILYIEIPGAVIARGDPAALAGYLPAEFVAFWQAEPMPSSPFKASGLGDLSSGAPEF